MKNPLKTVALDWNEAIQRSLLNDGQTAYSRSNLLNFWRFCDPGRLVQRVDEYRSRMYSSSVNEGCSFTLDGSRSLLATILRAAQSVEGRVESALGSAGLSLAKLGVLNHLVQSAEPLPLGRIAERISCVKSNVTQLVDRLEAEGLVVRVNDSHDRRCVLAAITDEGRLRYAAGAEILKHEEKKIADEIEPLLHADLISCLSSLAAANSAR